MNNIDQIIHMPDLMFVKLCEEYFKVNRGIFNTIDDWFYKKGYNNLLIRRKMIILFLKYKSLQSESIKRLKFGTGGLTPELEEFEKLYVA